jgi:hypothetical protein
MKSLTTTRSSSREGTGGMKIGLKSEGVSGNGDFGNGKNGRRFPLSRDNR